jgi:hypothetical protein
VTEDVRSMAGKIRDLLEKLGIKCKNKPQHHLQLMDLNPISNITQSMPESQGSPQNTEEALPKRDYENPKAEGILNSVRCLWDYLEGIAEKRLESPITKLDKIYLKLYKSLVPPLVVAFLLSFAIFIIMILFPKLTETIPTTLIKIPIIIAFILAIILMIIFVILIIIKDAPYHIIPIFGFRGLIRMLPALIDELKDKLPKDVKEDAQKYIENYQCMEHFKGNAAEALSRISQSTFFLMWINLILLSFIILFFVIGSILIILHLLGLKISSISLIESAITKTVVEIALWVLGVALSIVIGLFLFSSQTRFDVNTLHFVYDVKFTVLEWFVFAMFLIIISVIVPPFAAILFTVPAIIALIISITVYIILASAIIDYMQLP